MSESFPLDDIADAIVKVKAIIKATADEFGITPAQLKGPGRMKALSYPRNLAMYLACVLVPSVSLPQLGVEFGGRHHTTILYARNKFRRLAAYDVSLHVRIASIKTRLELDATAEPETRRQRVISAVQAMRVAMADLVRGIDAMADAVEKDQG